MGSLPGRILGGCLEGPVGTGGQLYRNDHDQDVLRKNVVVALHDELSSEQVGILMAVVRSAYLRTFMLSHGSLSIGLGDSSHWTWAADAVVVYFRRDAEELGCSLSELADGYRGYRGEYLGRPF